MPVLKKIHFYFGITVVVHFVITGLLMRWNTFSLEPQDITTRMMFRANHVYILFSGLINLLISFCYNKEDHTNLFHSIASGLMIFSTIALNAGFYIDPVKNINLKTDMLQRAFTGYSVIGCVTGTVLHLMLLRFYDRIFRRASTKV